MSSTPQRVALVSLHTSPLAQPGTGDAGGLNVYVAETAKQLAHRGVEVEIFTRATSSTDAPVVQMAEGVLVRNIVAGPFEGLDKRDLPSQMCAFASGLMRAEANEPPGYYDVIHSHYWLSGQVGWLARDRWSTPLVHTAHTLAVVKNASLADGDEPEPKVRLIGEQQVVDNADRLIVNTKSEAEQLITFHNADVRKIDVVAPGVDLTRFIPGVGTQARLSYGIAADELVVTFVGRVQPLKAPDVLLKALAPLIDSGINGRKVRLLVVGGPSGNGLATPTMLTDLAARLGVSSSVIFLPPQPAAALADIYRLSDVVAVPSYSESFGLVAIEAQACGIPVIAANVGGLGVAVSDSVSGVLVDGHCIADWTAALQKLLSDDHRRQKMAVAAVRHAQQYSWETTAELLLASYKRAVKSFTADSFIAKQLT